MTYETKETLLNITVIQDVRNGSGIKQEIAEISETNAYFDKENAL